MEEGLIYKELSYVICRLLYKTQNYLGRYRSEKEYGDVFEKLLIENKIVYSREGRLQNAVDEIKQARNICDFVVENKIVVELKAVRILDNECYFQVKRYLAAGKFKLGLLVNFRQQYLSPKRILNSKVL
jgi:GxxExxY protein